MRSFRVLALGAAFALATCLGGCGTLTSVFGGGTTVPQATTAAAAEQGYTLVANLEVTYANSGYETKAQATVIKALDAAVYADVVAARTAVANNDNVALATALSLYNQAAPALATYLSSQKGGSP